MVVMTAQQCEGLNTTEFPVLCVYIIKINLKGGNGQGEGFASETPI